MRLGGRGRNGRRPVSTLGGRPVAEPRRPMGEISRALRAFSGLLFRPVQAGAALPALRRHSSTSVVGAALVQGMHHSDPRKRVFSLQAFMGSHYRDAEMVSARALSDRVPEVRVQAVKTLGSLVETPHGGEQAKRALLDALKHPDLGVVLAASDEILARKIADDLPNTLLMHRSTLGAGDLPRSIRNHLEANLRLLEALARSQPRR